MLLAALLVAATPPPEGHFITDETATVSAQAKDEVDELAGTIHAGAFGELRVLVVESFKGAPPKKFGTQVFSSWPVGHAENVDGALLVMATKDKKAALVLGDGFGRIPEKEVEALLATAVLPSLEVGKPSDAVKAGALAVLRLLEKHRVVPDAGVGARGALKSSGK